MTAPRWLSGAAGVVLALVILVGGGYCAGARHAKAAAAKHETAALDHQADSLRPVIARLTAERDSQRVELEAVTAHTDTLMRVVTIRGPGIITIDTSGRQGAPGKEPGLGSVAVAPPVVVTVPHEVTDLIRSQATENALLRASLAVADSGWAAERALRVNREAAIHVMQGEHSWCGFKCGAVVTLATIAGVAYVVTKLDHRATPADGRVRAMQLGASVRF